MSDKRAAGGVGPYGCEAVDLGANLRDVGDAVPYGTVRKIRRGANLRAADSRPYGGDMTSPRWIRPAGVQQRDVEDAVPYGHGSNTVAETFVNAVGEGLAPPGTVKILPGSTVRRKRTIIPCAAGDS